MKWNTVQCEAIKRDLVTILTKVGLIGCVKTKLPHPAPAKELYSSTLFRGRKGYAERCYDTWLILSAKHHVLLPDTHLEPYDESLKNKSRAEQREWAEQVFSQLHARFPDSTEHAFYFHTGVEYRRDLIPLFKEHGYNWFNPVKGINIFNLPSWYAEQERKGEC